MGKSRKLHFTGIGSPVMFDLAIAMKQAGHAVTGADANTPDGVVNARLNEHQLSPDGAWHPERLSKDLDALIIGPAVQRDNPELTKASELKIPVLSYPEFVYQECVNKHRVVVTGSSGKTMIALLILHVLNYHKRSFDYVLGRSVPGLKDSVKLTEAPVVIIEGLDGPASCLEPATTFLKYQHHIGIISGIEWFGSHSASKDEYSKQFSNFEQATPKGGVMIYFDLEPVVGVLSKPPQTDVLYVPYKTHTSLVDGGLEYLTEGAERFPIKLSGKHNMQNISAAKETVKRLGITTPMFFEAMRQFGGDAI